MTCYRYTNTPRTERQPREVAWHFSGGVVRKSSRSKKDVDENERRGKTCNDERRNIKTFRGRRRRCCERTKVWVVGTLYSFPYSVSPESGAAEKPRHDTPRERAGKYKLGFCSGGGGSARDIRKKKRDKINRFLSASYHRRKCCCFALVFLGHNVI